MRPKTPEDVSSQLDDAARLAKRPGGRVRLAAWLAAFAALAGLGSIGVWPLFTQGLRGTGMDDAHPATLWQLAQYFAAALCVLMVWRLSFHSDAEQGRSRKDARFFLLLQVAGLAVLVFFVLQLGRPERAWNIVAHFDYSRISATFLPLGVLVLFCFELFMLLRGSMRFKLPSLLVFLIYSCFVIAALAVMKGMTGSLFVILAALVGYSMVLVQHVPGGGRTYRDMDKWLYIFLIAFVWQMFLLGGLLFVLAVLALVGDVLAWRRRSANLQAASAGLFFGIAAMALWRMILGTGYVPSYEEVAATLWVCLGAAMLWAWLCGPAGGRETREAAQGAGSE